MLRLHELRAICDNDAPQVRDKGMAGYSGTPLPKKLGIKDGLRVRMDGVPVDVRAELKPALAGCKALKSGPFDFGMLFVKSQAELQEELASAIGDLSQTGMIWIAWPKKSSGVACDMNENDVREIGLAAGLVDIKVCAVNATWSGLKFVIPVAKRK
jgi:hypothetical protein